MNKMCADMAEKRTTLRKYAIRVNREHLGSCESYNTHVYYEFCCTWQIMKYFRLCFILKDT